MSTIKLILINGPVGVGKSSVVELIHGDMPFSLKVDIDQIKFSIADFRSDNVRAVGLAIQAGIAMARYYLSTGNSVIIDRMI